MLTSFLVVLISFVEASFATVVVFLISSFATVVIKSVVIGLLVVTATSGRTVTPAAGSFVSCSAINELLLATSRN